MITSDDFLSEYKFLSDRQKNGYENGCLGSHYSGCKTENDEYWLMSKS